jgi:hypothetical protein
MALIAGLSGLSRRHLQALPKLGVLSPDEPVQLLGKTRGKVQLLDQGDHVGQVL